MSRHVLCNLLPPRRLKGHKNIGRLPEMRELQEKMAELIRHAERQAADPVQREIVLNLQDAQVISSSLINELIRISLRLRMSERRLLLTNVQPHVCEVLRLLRLDRTFEYRPAVAVCEGIEQASTAIEHRRDPAQKIAGFFLRRSALRSLS